MKNYTVNYNNLKNGDSKSITVEAKNIKEAKVLAQRHKSFAGQKDYTTTVKLSSKR